MSECVLSEPAQQKLAYICCAVRRAKSKEDARRAAWGAAIAVGALPPEHEGKSMTEISDDMGVTRAAVSKKAKSCQVRFALPPSHYMKQDTASKAFRDARIEFIKNGHKKK